jgi:hypothetical protein
MDDEDNNEEDDEDDKNPFKTKLMNILQNLDF